MKDVKNPSGGRKSKYKQLMDMDRFHECLDKLIETDGRPDNTNGWGYNLLKRKLNIPNSSMFRVTSGKGDFSIETLYKVAECFDVSIDWLLGRSNVKKVKR